VRSSLIPLVLVLFGGGCLGPRETLSVRYFSVDPLVTGSVEGEQGSPVKLRLRHVVAADYLRDRFVWRSGREYGFDETRRWTELPVAYVQRAFEEALFDSGRALRSEGHSGWTLDLRLEAFERALNEGALIARCRVRLQLSDAEGNGLLDSGFVAEQLIGGAGGADVAAALEVALGNAVRAATDEVLAIAQGG